MLDPSGQFLDKGFDMLNEFLSLIEPTSNVFGFEANEIVVVPFVTIIE